MNNSQPIWYRDPWHWLAFFGFTVIAGMVCYEWASFNWLASPNTPAWVQAFGSSLALVVAIWLPASDRKRMLDERIANEKRVRSASAAAIRRALDLYSDARGSLVNPQQRAMYLRRHEPKHFDDALDVLKLLTDRVPAEAITVMANARRDFLLGIAEIERAIGSSKAAQGALPEGTFYSVTHIDIAQRLSIAAREVLGKEPNAA